MKTLYTQLFIIIFFAAHCTYAQQIITLSRAESEAVFLQNNLLIVARQLQISQAEAMAMQARLWPNPSLIIEEVNLWTSETGTNNRSYFGESLPPISGKFGENLQVSISIEQLIITARKRKNLVALEQVNVEMAHEYFEILLRTLKVEFRNLLTEIQYQQKIRNVYTIQLKNLQQFTKAYQRQVEIGSVQQAEYIRLKALELELSGKIAELNRESNRTQSEIRQLMGLPPGTQLLITDDGFMRRTESFDELVLTDLIGSAKLNRPDFRLAQLELSYSNRLYDYEKSKQFPDFILKGSYDRGGNFLYNFVGFGLAIDLPVINRNQGNIRYARTGIEIAETLHRQALLNLENDIALAWSNLANAINFLNTIDPDFDKMLDNLQEAYSKNFENKNISMIEYLDFFAAYLENKRIILDAFADVNKKIEELNYSVALDLMN